MKVLDPHQSDAGMHPDPEALIEEARQRQRKRRWLIGIVVIIVAVASGVWAVSGGGTGTKLPSSLKKPGHVKSPAGAPGSAKKGASSRTVTTVGLSVLGITFPSASHGFASVLRCGAIHCYLGIEATLDGGVTWHQVANLA